MSAHESTKSETITMLYGFVLSIRGVSKLRPVNAFSTGPPPIVNLCFENIIKIFKLLISYFENNTY